MPLDRFVLILVLVMVAAGLTVWVGALLVAAAEWPSAAIGGLTLTALLAAIVVRVIRDRLRDRDDARYDRIEK